MLGTKVRRPEKKETFSVEQSPGTPPHLLSSGSVRKLREGNIETGIEAIQFGDHVVDVTLCSTRSFIQHVERVGPSEGEVSADRSTHFVRDARSVERRPFQQSLPLITLDVHA